MILDRTNPAAFIATCHCGWTHSEPKAPDGSFNCEALDAAVNEHEATHAPPSVARPIPEFVQAAPR